MTRAIQQGDGITPIEVGSRVHGLYLRMGCRDVWIRSGWRE